MDDIAEQHDISREITDAISNNVAFPNDIDEDELEKELEELEQVCVNLKVNKRKVKIKNTVFLSLLTG